MVREREAAIRSLTVCSAGGCAQTTAGGRDWSSLAEIIESLIWRLVLTLAHTQTQRERNPPQESFSFQERTKPTEGNAERRARRAPAGDEPLWRPGKSEQ